MLISGITIFFIHFINGMGFSFLSSDTGIFNFTTFDILHQLFSFYSYSLIAITVIWIIIVNHSIITNKIKDLSIMKALGTIQSRLISFYLSEIFLINLIGIFLGIAVGFSFYLLLFFGLSIIGFKLIFYIDLFSYALLIGSGILFSFIINGYELKRITHKKYAELSSDQIYHNYRALTNLKLIPKLISKISAKVKISISNITRKKNTFYRILILISFSLCSIMMLSLGGLLVGNTLKSQINYSQGNGTIIIGHKDIIDHYSQRYEEFSNDLIVFNNTENLIQQEYLFNSSIITLLENKTTSEYDSVEYWDRRLFVYLYASEVDGLLINFQDNFSDSSSYTIIGQDRTGILPVIGIEYKSYIKNWQYYGTFEYDSKSIIVGDTLANNFFDYAIMQSLDIFTPDLSRYNVTGILYDSFCRGNASYFPLESLQNDLDLKGMINIAVLGVNPDTNKSELINRLKLDLLNAELGENFSVIDLSKVFQNNINALNQPLFVSYGFIIFQSFIIIWALNHYQKAVFQDRIRDLSILRAIGVKKKFIKGIIFFEDLMIIIVSTGFALGFSLIFSIFLLGQTAILPPILNVILLWLTISATIILIRRISIEYSFKDINDSIMNYLKR